MDEQKRPRAWVYARIPGDYDGTMNSYKVCSMQALHDGCDIVGGSIDECGGWLAFVCRNTCGDIVAGISVEIACAAAAYFWTIYVIPERVSLR